MPLLDVAGRFDCVVMPAQTYFGESGENKTPFVGIPVEVTDGPQAGKHATAYLWLSEKAFDRTITALAEAFGFDGDLDALASGAVTFEGLPCSITTAMEEYDGKMRCKVQWLNALGGGGNGITPMADANLKGLIAKMGARAKAVAAQKKGNAPVAPRPAPAAAAEASQDEMPF